MADSGVTDRWHKSRPQPDERRCEHNKVPTADHGRGKRWLARWRDANGEQRKRGFDKKAEAEAQLATVRADLLRGVYIDPAAGRVTLRNFGDSKWLPAQVHLRPNSATLYGAHLRNHIYPLLGGNRLGQLKRSDMKSFVAALTKTLAPATVHTVFAVLRSLMQSAVDDGLIPGNPCSRVPLPLVERGLVEPLPAEAIHALVKAITPRYAVTVWLAAGAGLREGEALGLIVPRVEFLARRLLVHKQMQNGELVELKTKASRRTVPLDDVVINALSAHLQRWPASKPAQLVVTNRLRKPVQRSSFGYCWREAVEAAGLPKGTRFHDLRHFYASALIAANLHPKTIQVRLGHATIAETMDTYGHLFPDAESQGRGALDAALARPDVPPMCPEARAE